MTKKLIVALLFLFLLQTVNATTDCKKQSNQQSKLGLYYKDTYKNMPFSENERLIYRLYYGGVFVGYGDLQVLKPKARKGYWHQSFYGKAKTGSWYKYIFEGHNTARSYAMPQTFAVREFYFDRDENPLVGRHLQEKKWLYFNHEACSVKEIIKKVGAPDKFETSKLEAGAADVLGVFFKIRTYKFQIGKTVKILVFSSEKNWWLEATPEKKEILSLEIGRYEAMKLQLKTYIGKELQQQGKVAAWIATKHPNHPILKITGKIKIGSVDMILSKFTPGLTNK